MNRNSLFFYVILCLSTMFGCEGKENANGSAEEVDTLQMLVMQARQCSRLYTTEYHIHKIVTHNDLISLKGKLFNQDYQFRLPIGDRKIAFPIDATLKGYIDMDQLSERNFIREGNKLTIILPNPKVVMTSSKIDQANVKEFVSLTRAHFSDRELAEFERQGREAIINNIPNYGIEQQTRKNAARLLIPIVTKMGFNEEDVTISFSDDFNPSILLKSVELNTSEK